MRKIVSSSPCLPVSLLCVLCVLCASAVLSTSACKRKHQPLEAIPELVAARITETLRVPTIGIGAGVSCDGQVLVWHDLLGLTTGHVPQFVKRYADLADLIAAALKAYVADVRAARFPESRHTYAMLPGEVELFQA